MFIIVGLLILLRCFNQCLHLIFVSNFIVICNMPDINLSRENESAGVSCADITSDISCLRYYLRFGLAFREIAYCCQ